ncbi:MAG: FAD-dependent thymidylate synthase [Clostridia bacterium]|nr:FAD-dependent thymidylate synthase [Clostridia bacterium]
MKVQLIAHSPDPDKIIAAAAKLCYSAVGTDEILEGLTPEKTEKFIDMLSSLGHESPVEHATFTFAVEGVSRSLLAQLTRHRIASFSVQSQRYVGKENFEFIIPPEIDAIPEARELFLKAMENDRETYRELNRILTEKHTQTNIEAGMDEKKAATAASKKANEDSRYVLSNACDTKIVMTFNVRSLYNFFSLRCCSRAQWEIRELACRMLALVKEVSPALFKNAGPSCVSGRCSEGSFSCGKMNEVRKIIKNGGIV